MMNGIALIKIVPLLRLCGGNMQNILFTRYAWNTSEQDSLTHLYEGRIDYDSYEAMRLLHELIMFARFDRPMSSLWNNAPMLLVYEYLVTRLIMMRVCPFVGVFPRKPKMYFNSEFNRHMYRETR